MKKLLMFFALMIGLVSCGSGDNTAAAKSPEKYRVEVIYFHGKQRCATCMAIEKNAKEVVTRVRDKNHHKKLNRQLGKVADSFGNITDI